MNKPRKTITRAQFIEEVNSQLVLAANTFGIPNSSPMPVDYDDIGASRILMRLFKDYRGFKIRTASNGATYAKYA